MSRLEELRAKRAKVSAGAEDIISNAEKITNESYRVAEVAHNAPIIIKNLDAEFESQTKLRGKDIALLFFATALQCVRQYVLTNFKSREEREGHDKTAKKTTGEDIVDPHNYKAEKLRKEKGLEVRHHRLYNPTLDEIWLHPVPFDTVKGSRNFKDTPFKDVGSLKHRAGAIGHDPILGWIFGTANIATSTITGWNMKSFHVSSKLGKGGGDFMSMHADTSKVLSYTFDKLLNQGLDGKKIIGFSILKEGVHLASDVKSKDSLPFPVVSSFDPKLASTLADYGIDMANILTLGKQVAYAQAINLIIAMIHRLTFNAEKDGNPSLFEVRTRKIIDYSNVIASASNILVVALGAGIGAATGNEALTKKSLRKLDIGGIALTLYRLVSDHAFIQDLKQEFILNNFDKMIQGGM